MIPSKPRPCSICGGNPSIATTLAGMYYVRCFSHCETRAYPSAAEAVGRWNEMTHRHSDDYDPNPASQFTQAPSVQA